MASLAKSLGFGSFDSFVHTRCFVFTIGNQQQIAFCWTLVIKVVHRNAHRVGYIGSLDGNQIGAHRSETFFRSPHITDIPLNDVLMDALERLETAGGASR